MSRDKQKPKGVRKRGLIKKIQFRKIFNHARKVSKNFALFILAGYTTGMRIKELIGLTWADVDLKHREIMIPAFKSMANRGRKISPPAVFWKQVTEIADAVKDAGQPVLLNPEGNKWDIATLSRYWQKVIGKISGGGFSIHDLRRSAMTRKIRQKPKRKGPGSRSGRRPRK
jgi:integrase